MAIHSLSALVVLTPFLLREGATRILQVDRPALQTLRALLLTVEGFGLYAAVACLPLADVVTCWLAAPIYVAALGPAGAGRAGACAGPGGHCLGLCRRGRGTPDTVMVGWQIGGAR